MTTLEENKAIARRFLDLVSEHNLPAMIDMITPDWTMHGGPPALPKGAEGVRKLFETIGPVEQEWIVEDIIAEGDKVVVRAVNKCVQDSFFGVPGRGKQQVFSAVFIHHIKGGKIAETWRNADDLGRIFQLGGKITPGA